jgi:protease-4
MMDVPNDILPEPETPPQIDDESGSAIVQVHGVLGQHLSEKDKGCGGCDVADVRENLMAALDSPARAVILDIDSPGGTVGGIPELAEFIAKAGEQKPIIAFSDSRMCSAAYWLASQATAIAVSQSSKIGSIGVYMALLDESRRLANQGTAVNTFSVGKWKLSGAPWRPLADEERVMFQSQVDRIGLQFKVAISSRREIDPQHCEGQCFDGDEAVRFGLADSIVADMDEAIEFASGLTLKTQ